MSHMLSDEEQQLRAIVTEFADDVVAPLSYEADRTHTLPLGIVRQMGDMGLFGLPFPEEVGGQGGDYFSLCLAIEAIARVDQSIAITLEAGVGLGAMPLFRWGSDEQKQRWLPDLIAGRALAGFGLTEAEAGSDAGATRTTAVLDGEDWVINGGDINVETIIDTVYAPNALSNFGKRLTDTCREIEAKTVAMDEIIKGVVR